MHILVNMSGLQSLHNLLFMRYIILANSVIFLTTKVNFSHFYWFNAYVVYATLIETWTFRLIWVVYKPCMTFCSRDKKFWLIRLFLIKMSISAISIDFTHVLYQTLEIYPFWLIWVVYKPYTTFCSRDIEFWLIQPLWRYLAMFCTSRKMYPGIFRDQMIKSIWA